MSKIQKAHCPMFTLLYLGQSSAAYAKLAENHEMVLKSRGRVGLVNKIKKEFLKKGGKILHHAIEFPRNHCASIHTPQTLFRFQCYIHKKELHWNDEICSIISPHSAILNGIIRKQQQQKRVLNVLKAV